MINKAQHSITKTTSSYNNRTRVAKNTDSKTDFLTYLVFTLGV